MMSVTFVSTDSRVVLMTVATNSGSRSARNERISSMARSIPYGLLAGGILGAVLF